MNIYQLQEKIGQKFFVWPEYFVVAYYSVRFVNSSQNLGISSKKLTLSSKTH